jgi:ATP-binding cassette subfamily B protein
VASFKQRDATDCGPACLKYVADHYQLRIPIPRFRQMVGTGSAGSSVYALVEAARSLGFSAKGVKGPITALAGVPVPAIAHVLIDQRFYHYLVLVAWSRQTAKVMDPASGRVEKWTHARFTAVWTGVLVLLAPGDTFQPGDHTTSPWRRLWRLVGPHRPALLQAFAGAMASTVLALSMSIYVQKIVDSVIPDGNPRLLGLLTAAMLAILVIRLVLGVFQSLLSLRTAQCIDASLILAYYRRLLQLPQPFFDTMRVGEITSRVADAVKIRNFLNNSLLNLLLNPLILAFSLGAMFFYSWKLALLSVALVPLNGIVYWVGDRFNRTYQRRIMERAADFDAQLVESLNAQSVVRRFRLEEQAGLRTEIRLVRLLRSTWDAAVNGLGCSTAAALFTQAYLIALLWIGAGLVLETGLSPGQLMSCYTLAGYLTGPLAALVGLNATIQETLIATDRLFEIMDLETEIDQGSVEFAAEKAGDIRFEEVSFRHAGRPATLQGLSVTVPARQITVLAGDSGCGKSTFLALLQRLYLPEKGRILIGALDIRYFKLASLRRHFAVVPQQSTLLSGTVLENLAPGSGQPDMERLLKICQEVGATEFIEKLPQGFFTHLNENGVNLSGGQRQRLVLARALYLDAPILLLDEPSSALDAPSEQVLMDLLARQRAAGKTILLAAHSPRLFAIADQIVTLADGRVETVVACTAGRPACPPAPPLLAPATAAA